VYETPPHKVADSRREVSGRGDSPPPHTPGHLYELLFDRYQPRPTDKRSACLKPGWRQSTEQGYGETRTEVNRRSAGGEQDENLENYFFSATGFTPFPHNVLFMQAKADEQGSALLRSIELVDGLPKTIRVGIERARYKDSGFPLRLLKRLEDLFVVIELAVPAHNNVTNSQLPDNRIVGRESFGLVANLGRLLRGAGIQADKSRNETS
jgi:hypothetical protein